MRKFESIFGVGAAAALFLMMALTFCDVIARKLIGNSIVGSTELTEVLMLLTIFLGLPVTSLRGEHVVFDLLDAWLPRWGRELQHRIAHLFCIAALSGGAWLVELRAMRTVEDGDLTAQLGIPVGPLHHMAAALLLLTALMHLYLLRHRPAEKKRG